jgi:hypothetical protein
MNSQSPEMPAFFEALERRHTKALVDRAMEVIESMHSPSYELITPAGKVFSRKAYLAAIADEPFYAAWNISEFRVRYTERMTVVRYKAAIQFPSGREVHCWHTDTYENHKGHWLAAWSQATEVKAVVGRGSHSAA